MVNEHTRCDIFDDSSGQNYYIRVVDMSPYIDERKPKQGFIIEITKEQYDEFAEPIEECGPYPIISIERAYNE